MAIDAALAYNGVGAATESEVTGTTGSAVDEEQQATVSDATSGTFTLTFAGQTTAILDWDATAGEVETALEALSNLDVVTVSGSAGGPFTIAFGGSQSGLDVAELIADAQRLENSGLLRTISFTFNAADELTQASDPAATYDYVYDGTGRLKNFVQNIAGLTPEIEFESTYDAASRRTTLQAVIGSTDDYKNTYGYDALDRLTSLVQEDVSGGNAVAQKRIDLAYNAASQFTRIDRYADLAGTEYVASSHYLYDDMSRLHKLVHAETTTTPSSGWGIAPLAGYEYDYDEASRVLALESYLDGLTEYEHDDTNQLIAADHALATDEAYEYDANGNRIMPGYDVDPNNQLYSDGIYNYAYDSEGNRETRTKISNGYVTHYEWDHRNRLTKVTEKDDVDNVLQVTEHNYDYLNQWTRRILDEDGPGSNAAVDTFFAYEAGQVTLEFDGGTASDVSSRRTWGPQTDLLLTEEQVSSMSSEGSVIWAVADHLGTINDLILYDTVTDSISSNHREFASYGSVLSESNVAIASTIGFTGRMWDHATGLQYNLNRWYDRISGQWLNEDPIGFLANDNNLRRYVGNNPTGRIDPEGLETIELVHQAPPEAALKIAKGGLNAGTDKLRWLITPEGVAGKGSGASAASTTHMHIQVSIASAKAIPKEVLKAGELAGNQAVNAMGKGLDDNVRNAARARAKWNFVADWINRQPPGVWKTPNPSVGTDVRFPGKEVRLPGTHYAFTETSWKTAKPVLTEIRGPGANQVIAALGESSDEAAKAAAYSRWGKSAVYASRGLTLVAAGASVWSIYKADDKARQAAIEAGGWSMAYVGAQTGTGIAVAGGQMGPQIAAPEELATVPICAFIFGAIGYWSGSRSAAQLYDMVFTQGIPLYE